MGKRHAVAPNDTQSPFSTPYLSGKVLEEFKDYVGFGPEDGLRIRLLAAAAEKAADEVVRHFYGVLVRNERARSVFSGGDAQLEKQRTVLRNWYTDLFSGTYDDAYFQQCFRIGKTHVEVGLEQRFMMLGMELIWQDTLRLLKPVVGDGAEPAFESLHKLLMLNLAVMLESYQQARSDLIRMDERAAVNEKLIRAEHLAEIGQLAAALAHEIKNPLAGISGAIQVIGDGLPTGDGRHEVVREILGQIGRLDATVRDLLHYARPQPPRLKRQSLGQIVTRTLQVLKEEPLLQELRVQYESPVRPTDADIDEAQLEQLLINLILNAAQASQPGGVIRICIDGKLDRICLSVQDRGKGIPPEVLAHATEPFFTTKSKGTGLGLSICKRTAEAHGGELKLESKVGRGTMATLCLPKSRIPSD